MNPTHTITRTLAALAASTLVAGLAVTATTTASEASSGSSAGAAGQATHAKALRPFKVTAKVNTDEPEQGSVLKIKGTVKPLRPGDKVRIEKKADGKGWKLVGKAVINKKGKFKYTDEIDTVRSRQYRVVKNPDENRAEGTSPTIAVTVYGWRFLTSLSPVSGGGTYETSSVDINAKAYGNSIVGYAYYNSGSIAYNLGRQCKALETRVGLSDTSAITATGNIVLTADTTEIYDNSFELTESAPLTRDVTDVFRLTMNWTSSNTAATPPDTSGAVVALGSPRLLCSF